MIQKVTYRAVGVVAIIVVILAGFFVVYHLGQGPPNVSGSGSSSLNNGVSSIQATNQTIVATYVASLGPPSAQSTSTISTMTTSTYSTSSQSLVSGGSYTYTSSAQVKIITATAVVSGGSSGRYVTFSVQFQNIGNKAVDVVTGGGSSLNAEIISGAAIVTQVNGPRCEIATALITLSPSEEMTSKSPGCWSGYTYELTGAGTIQVQMTLSWSGDSSAGSSGGSIQIDAQFTLS